MKLRVLALALDGTIAVEGRLDGDVANALREARRAGIMTVLVSGRFARASLARGDFSRWARDVLGDADVAAGLAKLETTSATGAPVDREELRRHLHARYVL